MGGASAEDKQRLSVGVSWILLRKGPGGAYLGAWDLLVQDLRVEARKILRAGNIALEIIF